MDKKNEAPKNVMIVVSVLVVAGCLTVAVVFAVIIMAMLKRTHEKQRKHHFFLNTHYTLSLF